VDAFAHQVAERGVDGALALEAGLAGESGRFDGDREMAFAAAVVAGMAAMLVAVVDHFEPGRSERLAQAFVDLGRDWAGESGAHRAYIERFGRKGSSVLASAGKKQARFHGRVEGRAQSCAHPGCDAAGEFRAPGSRRPTFDGPGEWRWLCLDHVREFNTGYNYFQGMTSEEIADAQRPYGGWDRETRAFSCNGDRGPRWADFVDPLDAIGARFARRVPAERQDGREVSERDRRHLQVLGLDLDADRRGLRLRYAELLRRYHPDHNGGDRSHEKALQAVIEAYTALKSRPAFA
jgi:DnaJ-like protein